MALGCMYYSQRGLGRELEQAESDDLSIRR